MMNDGELHLAAEFFANQPLAKAIVRLFEYLPSTVFYAKDAEGRFVAANTAMLDAKGLSDSSEILGATDYHFHPPLLAEAYREEDRRVMSGELALPHQVWYVLDRSGRPGWFSSSKVPLLDNCGTVIGIAGIRYLIETPADREREFRELAGVIAILEARHHEQLSMKELAEASGMSATDFNRKFAKLIGVSPTRLLHAIRIDRARQLLARTDRTISDVALDVGYYDQSHFSKHFRKHCGMSPRQYRQRFRS